VIVYVQEAGAVGGRAARARVRGGVRPRLVQGRRPQLPDCKGHGCAMRVAPFAHTPRQVACAPSSP
jgi:hypothetical protein